MIYDAQEFRKIAKNFLALIPDVCESREEAEAYTIVATALRNSVEEAERLRNERNNVAGSCLAMRDDIERKDREIARLHEVCENARKAVLKQRWNDVLFLLNGDSENRTEEELEAEENLFRLAMAKKDFITEKLQKEIDEHHAILERIRFHAQKMVEWKGAPDPFGPLHGSGMVLCANAEGKRILKLLDGEVLSYSDQHEESCKSVPSHGKNETERSS